MPCMSSEGMGQGYDYEARAENDRLARVSCDIMRVLEMQGIDLSLFNGETREWWDRHKAEDRRRETAAATAARKQELRQAALAKLSPDEREALGL